jgi:hypothetical protein
VKHFTNSDKEKLAFERESKRYNQKTANNGAVWSNDCAALLCSTDLYLFFCDFAFSLIKEQNSTFIRAPPLNLKPNHFKLNGGLIIVNLFY